MGLLGSTTSRRRTAAVVATAGAVGLVLLGAVAAGVVVDDQESGAPVATAPEAAASSPESSAPPPAPQSSASQATVELDLAQVGSPDPAAVSDCLADGIAESAGPAGTDPGTVPDAVEVLYAVRQRSADGDGLVLLLRTGSGDLTMCDAAGHDVPAQLPLPEVTAASPVAFLTNGTMAWDCDGTTVDGYTATTWLRVGPEVDRVQQRYFVDGVAGPWFSTGAYDGYAHLQTWLTGPLTKGATLAVQHRVLDEAGDPVPQDAFPDRRTPLGGCRGGDVAIG